jgi:glycosyltransferase involved in cell wall biosynthesis
VVVVSRNGAIHIRLTLDSLLNQSQKPDRISVVDDGSTDETPGILREYIETSGIITTLTLPDRGYDIRRVPSNINYAWDRNRTLRTEYFMVSGDDCTYPDNYAETLTRRMNLKPSLVVASGRPSTIESVSPEHTPSGSGRVIRTTFWRELGGTYPLQAGWETWLLYQAALKGFEVRLFEDLEYQHSRPRGAEHQFVYWGAAMATLGYHPLYALGRIAVNATRPPLAPRRSVNMLRGYLQSTLQPADAFLHPYDRVLRSFVNRSQRQRISGIVTSLLSSHTAGMISGRR